MANRLRKKLLFVDDDREMHAAMRLILDDTHDLTCVSSGEEAVDIVSVEIFPVVLLDLQMPGLSGLETLKLLKKNDEQQKVIILTGFDTKENAIEALNLGAFRFLIKPFENADLKEVLTEAFRRYGKELRRPAAIHSPKELLLCGLSRRQSEIAFRAVQGETNQEIANRLEISQRTVEKHMEMILEILGVESRVNLAGKINKLLARK